MDGEEEDKHEDEDKLSYGGRTMLRAQCMLSGLVLIDPEIGVNLLT